MGSSGTGGINHMAGELFRTMTGINMTHVPYRGAAPAMTDLLGGQVQVMFIGLPPSIEHIRSGRLRALAVDSGDTIVFETMMHSHNQIVNSVSSIFQTPPNCGGLFLRAAVTSLELLVEIRQPPRKFVAAGDHGSLRMVAGKRKTPS